MSKSLLIETQLFKPSHQMLFEGKQSPKGNPIVKGVLATAEVKNGNGRFYSKEIWDREIKNYLTSIKENRAMGELDHPDSQVINLKNVSHNIIGVQWDGNDIIGEIEILPTPSGNILKTLLENKIMVGVSSRGMGSVQQQGDILEVQDDFELLCFDFVSTPSNPNSWMHLVKESLNEGQLLNYNKYSKVNSIITEILCSHGNCSLN